MPDNNSASEKIMIGIDGGGTKTQFLLFTENGIILDNIKLDACNPNAVGVVNCINVLAQGIDILMSIKPECYRNTF